MLDKRLLVQAVHFKVKQYSIAQDFSSELLESPHLEVFLKVTAENLGYSLYNTIAAKAYIPMRELKSARWPKNWREALKERWLPAWALKRWPVQYERIKVEEILNEAIPRNQGRTMTLYRLTHELSDAELEEQQRNHEEAQKKLDPK